MSKFTLTLFIALTMSLMSFGQSKEKIKGSRNVTIEQAYIDPFEKIVINSDFSIEIAYNEKPSVEVEADDNLHEVIDFAVSDGVLTFDTDRRITSKKKLHIIVYYSNILNTIELKDKSEIRSLTSLELDSLDLQVHDNSRAYLNIRTTDFKCKGMSKGKARLNVTADSSYIELGDNSKIEALINTKTLKMDMYQRSDISIEGDAESTVLRLDNSTGFSGKNFSTKICDAVVEGRGNVTINTVESISIDASGNSQIYLYGEPKIEITKFTDTAKLQKKMQ